MIETLWRWVLPDEGFLNGFFTGQLVSIICIFFFIRYFLLASPSKYISIKPERKSKKAIETVDVPAETTSIDTILKRLGIASADDLNESCGWLNLILARLLFSQLHEDPNLLSRAIAVLEETVIREASPYIHEFAVSKLELNPDAMPQIEGFRLRKFFGMAKTLQDGPSTYCLEGRLRWREAGELQVDAAACAVCWPTFDHPLIILPASVTVRLISLDAMVRLAFPDKASGRLELSLVPEEYSLELEIESSIGHRAKLKNVEKVSQLIGSLLRGALEEQLVWPNRVVIEVPRLSDLLVAQ